MAEKKPTGYKLVPMTPDAEMLTFGTEAWLCEAAMEDRSAANYAAMLSVSPAPTAAELDALFLLMRKTIDRVVPARVTDEDRTRMLAFLTAIQGESNG
jgi:hypothetical protein